MRRAIAPVLEGARLEHVEIRDPRLTRPFDPSIVAHELAGERVTEVGRRGKYLIVRFVSGRALLIHLRMTGRCVTRLTEPRPRTIRIACRSQIGQRIGRRLSRRTALRYVGAARGGGLQPYIDARLGPEPLGPLTAHALDQLAGRRAPLKSALLDQRTVAGLGNIYADEALGTRRSIHSARQGASTATS